MGDSLVNSEIQNINSKHNRIIKYSRKIAIVLQIGKYVSIVFGLLYAFLWIGILSGILHMDDDIVIFGAWINILMPMYDFSAYVSVTDYHIILYGFSSLLAFALAIQIAYLHKVVKGWADGESPFKTENAKGIKILAIILSLIMLFFQPLYLLFGIMLFAFTYLMEYGNVLEDNSNNTINAHEHMVLSLAEVIEVKSGQTGQHVRRVSEYCRVLAEGLNLPKDIVNEIRVASMLHDIGKLLIPIEILEKPGKLTDEEFEQIKKHTRYGRDLLENTNGAVLTKAKLIADEHHEKWDGTGYNKKSGNDISIVARIVAIADVFDALVSKRSYKTSWTNDDARAEIIRCSGSHFDPKIVNVFIKQYDKIIEIKNKYGD